jgi:hypothetical protein
VTLAAVPSSANNGLANGSQAIATSINRLSFMFIDFIFIRPPVIPVGFVVLFFTSSLLIG